MNDPIQQLKRLPWKPLALNALLTIFLSLGLEFLLFVGAALSLLLTNVLTMLYAPPLGLLTELAVAIGIGALGVYLLERLFRQVYINISTLWALVLCLLLAAWMRSLLPIPAFLVSLNSSFLMGVVLGVFWKGKSYWR